MNQAPKRQNPYFKENVPKRRLLDVNTQKEKLGKSKVVKFYPRETRYPFESLPYSCEIHDNLLRSEVYIVLSSTHVLRSAFLLALELE
jgi:hypothetical protein